MLSSVEQAFVGRDEKRAPLKIACVGGYDFQGPTIKIYDFSGLEIPSLSRFSMTCTNPARPGKLLYSRSKF